MMNRNVPSHAWALAAAVIALALGGCDRDPGAAAVSHGTKVGGAAHASQHDHPHAEVRMPASLADVARFSREHLAALNRELASGATEHASDGAHALAMVAAEAGRLALADQAFPRDKVREVNIAGKELAEAAESLHELLDAGRVPEGRRALPALSAMVDRLVQAAGMAGWACPMKCEPGKVYDAAGKCPVCRMALARLGEDPYSVMVTSLSPLIAPGSPAELKIDLLAPGGGPVGDLDVVHEHALHLMTVSSDLSWYSHDHPVRQPDGSFRQVITFPAPGEYTFFADFTPTGTGQQVPSAAIDIAGRAPDRVPLVEDIDTVKHVDGTYVRLRCNGGPYTSGRDEVMRFGVCTSADGTPATDLEPLMGALGHLVIISEDLQTFVHSHPLNDEVDGPSAPAAGGSGDAHAGHAHHHHGPSPEALMARAAAYGNGSAHDPVFHVVFPRPGKYRAFAQFQRKGHVLTVPFTLDVHPGSSDAGTPDPAHDHEKMKRGA